MCFSDSDVHAEGAGVNYSCRDLPGDIGATAGDWPWHHRTQGVSQRYDHMGARPFTYSQLTQRETHSLQEKGL